jgi:hypothetical protein
MRPVLIKLRELLPEIHRNGPSDERANLQYSPAFETTRHGAIETTAVFALRGTLIDGRFVF